MDTKILKLKKIIQDVGAHLLQKTKVNEAIWGKPETKIIQKQHQSIKKTNYIVLR